MALTQTAKKQILKKFATSTNDTASPQVQVALITEQLNYLAKHFETHKKDHHSRRGLMKLVGRRRSLLEYLNRKDTGAYKKLIETLGIRK